jgi:hypothetical protein
MTVFRERTMPLDLTTVAEKLYSCGGSLALIANRRLHSCWKILKARACGILKLGRGSGF